LNVTKELIDLGIEVKYWGEDFIDILKEGEQLITI